MPNPILDAARQRLLAITAERAALDKEERELRAMVTAAEGAAVPVSPPVLPWPPTIDPSPLWPPFTPAPMPFPPWIVRADHGGMCACRKCLPRITYGEGWTSIRAEMPGLYVSGVNQSAGSIITVGPRSDGWQACGVSDLTGGPYYVKPGASWDRNPAGIAAPNGVRYMS